MGSDSSSQAVVSVVGTANASGESSTINVMVVSSNSVEAYYWLQRL